MVEIERVDLHHLHKDGYSSCSIWLLPSVLLNPKITDWQILNKLGFVNCYLYNKVEGMKEYHKDGILIILNPSYSFYQEDWQSFRGVIEEYKNFIEFIDFGNLIFGFWMGISPQFLPNVRYYYKLGKFSLINPKYISYLNEREKKIVLQDELYRKKLEFDLGLEEDELLGEELASKPSPEEYIFKL